MRERGGGGGGEEVRERERGGGGRGSEGVGWGERLVSDQQYGKRRGEEVVVVIRGQSRGTTQDHTHSRPRPCLKAH